MELLEDVQKRQDHRGITIQKVGVKKVRLPLLISTKKGNFQRVLGDISLGADLIHKHRGTHMSRFMEILNFWSKKCISSIQLKEILDEVCEKLDAKRAQISLRFKYFLEKSSPVSKSVGYLDYDCLFYGISMDKKFSFVIGVEVPVQLVCPCSKEIARFGAHNQRADIRIHLEYYPQYFIWIEDLITRAEEAGSSGVYPIIKREDEKLITEKSYQNPKFVEDVLRELVEYFRKDERIRWFEVECDSHESIHNHNAFAYQKECRGPFPKEKELIPIKDVSFQFR